MSREAGVEVTLNTIFIFILFYFQHLDREKALRY